MASLQYNLNRLLDGTNGVDIDLPVTYYGEQAAANLLAGTSGLGLVGALNEYAEPGRAPIDCLELQGVLNELAGTTGLGVEGAADEL